MNATDPNTELSEEERTVLFAVEREKAADVDVLARRSGLPPETVRQALQRLLVKGLIEEKQPLERTAHAAEPSSAEEVERGP